MTQRVEKEKNEMSEEREFRYTTSDDKTDFVSLGEFISGILLEILYYWDYHFIG